MANLGVISFQSLDAKDVFLKMEVETDGNVQTDEGMWNVEEAGFDLEKPGVNGRGKQSVSVEVEGDTSVIAGWFRGTVFPGLFIIRIYVEYEEIETVAE